MTVTEKEIQLVIDLARHEFDSAVEMAWRAYRKLMAVRHCSNCGRKTIIDDHGRCWLCGGFHSITLFGVPLPPNVDIKQLRRELRKG